MAPTTEAGVSKPFRMKVKKACDNCRKRKLKCTGQQPCPTCETYGCPCVYSGRSTGSAAGKHTSKKSAGGAPSSKRSPNTTISIDTNTGSGSNLVAATTTTAAGSFAINNDMKTPQNRHSPLSGLGTTVKNLEDPDLALKLKEASMLHTFPVRASRSHTPTSRITPPPSSASATSTATSRGFDGSRTSSNRSGEYSQGETFRVLTPSHSGKYGPPLSPNTSHLDSGLQNLGLRESISPLPRSAAVDTVTPVISGDNGLYMDDNIVQVKLSKLQSALNDLKALPIENPAIEASIQSIETQIQSLIDNWKPEIDMDKLLLVSKTSRLSLETLLMKNKYTDIVHLARYAVWSESTCVKDKSDQSNPIGSYEPLIDGLFGLYSPLQAFSFQAIGYRFLNFLKQNGDCPVAKTVKETLYLALRLFDMCFLHFREDTVSLANPLESYFSRRNIAVSPQTPQTNPLSTSSNTSSTATNVKSVISVLINRLPQQFFENSTGISRDELLNNINDDHKMFKLLLRSANCCMGNFESFMINMTARSIAESEHPAFTDKEIMRLLDFLDTDQILMPMLYSYYNTTQFLSSQKLDLSLEYIETLLSCMKKQRWAQDFIGLRKIKEEAINQAYRLGLYRWEFYVGLDENRAERMRKVWWDLYKLEKLCSIRTAHPTVIDDKVVNCLLPDTFRKLGFLDRKSFLSKLCSFRDFSKFESMSLQEMKLYAECAIALIAGEFQMDVLYNDQYTSIRNTSLPPLARAKLFANVVEKYDTLRQRFDIVKRQVMPLFELALNPNGDGRDEAQTRWTNEEVHLAKEFVLSFDNTYCHLLSTIDNLEPRLSSSPYTNSQFAAVGAAFRDIYYTWKEMTQVVDKIGDTYSLCKYFVYYCGPCVLIMAKGALLKDYLSIEDILSLFRLLRRLRSFWILNMNESYPQVKNSALFREYCRSISFLIIISRVTVGKFTIHHGISFDDIEAWLQRNMPELLKTFLECRDLNSEYYRYLLEPVQKSGFHLQIIQFLNNNLQRGSDTCEKIACQQQQQQREQEDNCVLGMPQPHEKQQRSSETMCSGLCAPTAENPSAATNTGASESVSMGANVVPPDQARSVSSTSSDSLPYASTLPSIKFLTSAPQNPPVSVGSFNSATAMPNNVVSATMPSLASAPKLDNDGDIMLDRDNNNNNIMVEPGQYIQNEVPDPYYNDKDTDPTAMNTDFLGYNLGTLDEFVNREMSAIYNTLWSDLYSDLEHID